MPSGHHLEFLSITTILIATARIFVGNIIDNGLLRHSFIANRIANIQSLIDSRLNLLPGFLGQIIDLSYLVLLVRQHFHLLLELFLHARPQVIRIEFSKVFILGLSPVEQDVAFVALITNAEENEKLSQEDAHIEQESRYDCIELRVLCHLEILVC